MTSRKTVVGLILAATVLFVIGILLEKGSEDDHHSESVAQASETAAERTAESGENAEGTTTESPAAPADEGAAGSEAGTSSESPAEAGEETRTESDETVLGIKYESTPFVILAVLASLGLAALVRFGRAPWIFALVAAALAAFAILDIAEAFRQVDRSEGGIAALAALVAVLHLAAGLFSVQLGRRPAPS